MSASGASGAARLPGVDALRALALLPVVVVNYASYATPLTADVMLAPRPADSLLAQLCTALAAGLLEAKGVTLLSFLFGYSLVMGSRAAARLKRLLGLGALHGLLLYFGDILGCYAAAGALALRRRHERLKPLLRRAGFWLLIGSVMLLPFSGASTDADGPAAELGRLHQARPFADWWLANARLYGIGWVVVLLILPLTYALMLFGIAAARLRLLSHRRWRPLWRRFARWALPLLLLNLGYGLWVAWALPSAAAGLNALLALLTLPSWVAWCLLRPAPAWLVRVGRNTLSIYIGSSLLLVLLLSGAGLALPLGSAATIGLALAVWLVLSALAAAVAARGGRLPLEALMARRPA